MRTEDLKIKALLALREKQEKALKKQVIL